MFLSGRNTFHCSSWFTVSISDRSITKKKRNTYSFTRSMEVYQREIQVHVLWVVDISGKPGNLLDNQSFVVIIPA